MNDFRDMRVGGSVAAGNDERGYGIGMAELIDVVVVVVVTSGPQDKKVSAGRSSAEPLKGFVEIGTAAHQGVTGHSFGGCVVRTTDADVFVRRSLREAGRNREQQQTNGPAIPNP